ncbi:hypothetical protein Cni_G13032 [Canna indica]|uniref:Uncharacterized protein n=1 Tax=Canna indica TaxID=4628 RepID=A0AAQ3Q9I8_9LILI|nr:hypothetical protein Cni_G13032 [Canna indica]
MLNCTVVLNCSQTTPSEMNIRPPKKTRGTCTIQSESRNEILICLSALNSVQSRSYNPDDLFLYHIGGEEASEQDGMNYEALRNELIRHVESFSCPRDETCNQYIYTTLYINLNPLSLT